jgi:hypothetical protein
MYHRGIVKIAEQNAKSHLRDTGLIIGGGALGAGASYGLMRLAKKRYGKTLSKIDPNKRLRYIVPLIGAATTAGALAHMQQNSSAKRNSRR